MLHGQIEREFSDGEPWSAEHRCKLPTHLELLGEQEQQRRDIWELPQQSDDRVTNKKLHRFWSMNLRFWWQILF
ncbi:MAG: hypothetical protein CLLPBCKN_006036 [Chroococcidiopsis cubana SAG 39.79]|uniref:Uncharacterized protein n=1 Tax=Chroococcidiopsis cubana SAG 39.79 TaxID=388085 RepID=A0AB37UFI0_9CYAN|nr:hypothetical protein [Chroococcidiopsis cubana]MDZ4876601.1 hypothetical protein [Chroococcidiopsis cubana SAG 39.79]RUT10337.1 hypothetical protein DSM107010_43330 [Chroococcidiopsis cubana SAG 39.79]